MKELVELASALAETARSSGAKDVIAEAIDSTVTQVRFSNSVIDTVNWWNERHVEILVAIGKKMVTSDIRDLDKGQQLVRQLVADAARSPDSKDYGGIASGRFKYAKGKVDKKLAEIDDPSKQVHEAIAGAESEGAKNVGGTFFIRRMRSGIASSGGAMADDDHLSADLSVRAFSQPEASGHAVSCTTQMAKLKARETGARAGKLSKMAMNPVLGHEGKTDLIIEPLFFGVLNHPTAMMLSGLWVEIGFSMYAKKIGKQVASKQVTWVDDPTMDSISHRLFDHEGVPTRRNVAISKGVLKTYLHNTTTAKHFKTKTTANAGPTVPTLFTAAAQPIAFHPVVVPGDWSPEEMISDTKQGLYLNNTWYTRFQNYATGEFSTIPRDAILKIENGEIVGSIKNIRVSDNLLNFWKNIDAISKSTQEVYWWDEASPPSTLPTVRIRGMNITRSA
jgi:PmbA protein